MRANNLQTCEPYYIWHTTWVQTNVPWVSEHFILLIKSLWIQSLSWKHLEWGKNTPWMRCQYISHVHSQFILASPPIGMFWEVGGNRRTQMKPIQGECTKKLDTSSRSNQSWSWEAATLPTAPPYQWYFCIKLKKQKHKLVWYYSLRALSFKRTYFYRYACIALVTAPLNRSSSGAAAVCLFWPGPERRRCSALHSSPSA